MNQMQAMQMNPNMMNQMQMNMNMMNQNQMNMMGQQMQQRTQQQPNLFNQVLANVNNTQKQQTQRPQQTYSHNDPFAQMMSGGTPTNQTAQTAPQRPKKTGPDPFAEFGLKSMQ